MAANARTQMGRLQVSKILFDFVNREAIPGTNVKPNIFWSGVESIIAEFSPDNRALLEKRNYLQAQIEQWHRTNRGQSHDLAAYKTFLHDIGYLSPQNMKDSFQISTTNVDAEIATQAGPQLVVPLMNARFTLNAANARWGSLYDALYGTDVISESDGCERTSKYNRKRGEKVIAFARQFLDRTVPLAQGVSHVDARKYTVNKQGIKVRDIVARCSHPFVHQTRSPHTGCFTEWCHRHTGDSRPVHWLSRRHGSTDYASIRPSWPSYRNRH